MTPDQIDDIKHALGISGGKTKPYRNHYCTDADDENMCQMVEAGYMKRGRTIPGGLVCFHVTDLGCEMAGVALPADEKLRVHIKEED